MKTRAAGRAGRRGALRPLGVSTAAVTPTPVNDLQVPSGAEHRPLGADFCQAAHGPAAQAHLLFYLSEDRLHCRSPQLVILGGAGLLPALSQSGEQGVARSDIDGAAVAVG